MPRLRLQVIGCPRRTLALTDTPRPNCPQCEGVGGTQQHYGHPETGEYAGTDWQPCACWNAYRCWRLLPLPRWPRRTPPSSTEPPF